MPTLLEAPKPIRRRAPWRQRLVDAERGFTTGFRADSTWFVYLFVNVLLLAIGGVLDLGFYDWLFVGLAMTMVLSAELMQQALRALAQALEAEFPGLDTERMHHLATAAVLLAVSGGGVIVLIIYALRISALFAD